MLNKNFIYNYNSEGRIVSVTQGGKTAYCDWSDTDFTTEQGNLIFMNAVNCRGIENATKTDTDFSITVNSGSDSQFILPTSGRLNNTNNSYNWIVDWGDGTISEHSGTGTTTTGITHIYPSADTNYRIKIKPINPGELGWLRAFGFTDSTTTGSNLQENKNKIIEVDGLLTEQMIRTKNTDNYVCAYMFRDCTKLTMGQQFNLPQEIISVGSHFCYSMFYGNSSLTINSIFQIPQNIISFQYYFCSAIFRLCPSITTGVINFFGTLKLPQEILDVGGGGLGASFYRSFGSCFNLTDILIDIPQLNMIPYGRRYTFEYCPAGIIAPLHANWK